tara:strand:+ start:220 stop:423 length:204 start_codon:yes stop_codon:yes gene_type:complete
MFDKEFLLEYLNSSAGRQKIILGIIMIGVLNTIFISYTVRNTYGAAKKEGQKLKLQQAKIDKLSPKK